MKIKRFNEINENSSDTHKFYVYRVHPGDTTHRGSIWKDEGKWVPDDAKLIGEFEFEKGWQFMTVSQEELDEINNIKMKKKIDSESRKFNI